jgi:hypothetical protein
MASIANPYNMSVADRQKFNNYANIKNDYLNAYEQPLHGGAYYGGDFFSDFMDGFNMVMGPVGDVIKTVAPFLPLVGLGECECESGSDCECELDGGRRKVCGGRRAGYNDDGTRRRYEDPLNRNEFICALPYSDKCNGTILNKKAMKYSTYKTGEGPDGIVPHGQRRVRGSGLSGGDEISDQDLNALQAIGLPQRYAQYFLGGRHPRQVPAGERRMLLRKALADAKLQNELRLIMNAKKGGGMSGGDFDWSSLLQFAPLLLGLGEDDGEEVYADMMGEGFWDDVGDFFTSLPSKIEEGVSKAFDLTKTGLSKASELAEAVKPIVDVYSKVSGKDDKKGGANGLIGMYDKSKYPDGMIGGEGFFDKLFNTDQTFLDMEDKRKKKEACKVCIGEEEGGAMTYQQNMDMADAMGDIFSGMGYSGGQANEANRPRVPSRNPLNLDAPVGMPNRRPLPSNSSAVQMYKGGDHCVNAPYVCDTTRIPINLQNRPTKEYLAMTGNGVSGGDWWSDFTNGLQSVLGPVGDVAKIVAPFLGEGMSGGQDCPARAIGAGVSGGRKSSAWIQHVKAYAKQHGIKYNEALKKAGATYKK